MAVVGRGFEVALQFRDVCGDAFAITEADGKCVFGHGESLIGGLLEPFGSHRDIPLGSIRAGIVDAEGELGAGIVLAGSLAGVFEFVLDLARMRLETAWVTKKKID
jgi:hypothetical protein